MKTFLICFALALASAIPCKKESKKVIVVSGGAGKAGLSVIRSDGKECDLNLGEVPQPYGEVGRIGSLMHSWDDNLVVCGGYSGSGPPFSSFKDCLNFNLNNRTWSNEPEMPTWTAFSGAAPSSNRKELFSVGGYHPKNSGPGPTEHIYSDMVASMDLDTRNWKVWNARLPRNTSHLCAGVGGDDHLYVVGQVNGKLDLETEEWRPMPDVFASSAGCTMTSLNGVETFVVVGGSFGGGFEAWSLAVGDPEANWQPLPLLPSGRMHRPSIHDVDGKLFVVGGGDDIFDVDVYDKNDGSWSVVAGGLKTPRSYHGATVVDAKFFPECDF